MSHARISPSAHASAALLLLSPLLLLVALTLCAAGHLIVPVHRASGARAAVGGLGPSTPASATADAVADEDDDGDGHDDLAAGHFAAAAPVLACATRVGNFASSVHCAPFSCERCRSFAGSFPINC